MVHIHDDEMGGSPVVTVVPNPWSSQRQEDRASRAEELAETLEGHKGEMQKGLAEFVEKFCYLYIALVMSL